MRSRKGTAVDPLPRRLLQVEQQAEHVATAHGVVAVVTRPPEDHRLTGHGIESDLLRRGGVGVDHDHGLLHGCLSFALVL